MGTAQKAKTPLLTADLLQVLAHLPSGLAGTRDRALLLVGYAGAFRRSELAALDIKGYCLGGRRSRPILHRSKTDQGGHGRQVAIPRGAHAATCPVRALRTWIDQAELTDGRLLRRIDRHSRILPGWLHPDAVGEIVQVIRYMAERLEVSPKQVAGFFNLLIETATTQTRKLGEFTIWASS